jgi:hypothetical protein
MRVDAAQERAQALVRLRDVRFEVVGEDRARAVEAEEAPRDPDADRVKPVEAEVLAAVRAAEREQGHSFRRLKVGELVDRPVEVSEQGDPGEDVAASVCARGAPVPADGDDDVPTGRRELERELLAAGAGADDQDRPVGDALGTAVLGTV